MLVSACLMPDGAAGSAPKRRCDNDEARAALQHVTALSQTSAGDAAEQRKSSRPGRGKRKLVSDLACRYMIPSAVCRGVYDFVYLAI